MPQRIAEGATPPTSTIGRVAPTTRRIALLSTGSPTRHGSTTAVPPLVDEFRRRGHHVHAIGAHDGQIEAALAAADVAIVQYDNETDDDAVTDSRLDADELLLVLQSLRIPTVVVVHKVPVRPTQHQHALLAAVVGTSHCTIVMSNGARQQLIDRYAIDPSRVVRIPHGGSIPDPQARPRAHRGRRHPQLLTWGPLGPGRGIEHVIDALVLLGDLRPRVQYTVAGTSHPNAFAEHGDQHRNSLIRRAWAAGVVGSVTFDDAHRRPVELDRFVASAKVVVLPYESRDHIASPVLVGTITAGLPVIATAFPHAVELLSGGAGLIVPHADPMALAEAIRSVAHDDRLYQTMAEHARDLAARHSWATVADQYLAVAERLVTANAVYT